MSLTLRLFLTDAAIFLAGGYLFSQSGMREMLFGTGLMLYGSINWTVDSLSLYVRDTVEVDLNKRIDKLEAQLKGLTNSN